MINKIHIKYCLLALLVLVVLFSVTKYKAPNTKSDNQNKISHHSATSLKSFFDDAYKESKPSQPDHSTIGIIVNHHLLAAHFIAESFGKIATNKPVTVLLISPNHFNTGSGAVTTSEATWQTPYGVVDPDLITIDKLAQNNIAKIEEDPFEQEHGISGILPFIKHALPNGKVIPLIVKEGLPIPDALEIARQIQSALPADTLIVGSFDFSHYLTHRAGDFHDISSLNVLQNFKYEKIPRLDIDSHPGLAMFLKLLELDQAQNFHLQEQSNSALLARTDSILETTSYITGYFTKGMVNASPTVHTLLALGSIDASTKTMSSLDRHNSSFSIKFLERLFFGQEISTAFIEPGQKLERALNKLAINQPISSTREVKFGNLRVGYISPTSKEDTYSLAHETIDAGMDIVFVNTPVKQMEIYKNKFIFHGLGQLLTNETLIKSRTTNSLGIGLALVNNTLAMYILPIQVTDGIGKLLTSPADDIVLKDLSNKSKVSPDIKKQILSGVIKINLNDYGTK